MRKFVDLSNPSARQSFASRFDALPDPMAKLAGLEDAVTLLSKVVTQQHEQIAQLTGNDAIASRRYGEALVKRAQVEVEANRIPERSARLAKAQGRQPPYVFGPITAPGWQFNYEAFRDRFRSH